MAEQVHAGGGTGMKCFHCEGTGICKQSETRTVCETESYERGDDTYTREVAVGRVTECTRCGETNGVARFRCGVCNGIGYVRVYSTGHPTVQC